jgi:hypothetical protein
LIKKQPREEAPWEVHYLFILKNSCATKSNVCSTERHIMADGSTSHRAKAACPWSISASTSDFVAAVDAVLVPPPHSCWKKNVQNMWWDKVAAASL